MARHLPAHNPTRVSQLPATDQTLVQQLPADTYTTGQPLPPHSILTSTPDLAECLLEHLVFDDNGNLPFRFATIREYQQQDHNVANLATTQPDKYITKNLGGHEIITLRNDVQQIIIPNSMLEKLVHWYHQATTHALGATRLYTTIHQHFQHPKLRSEIQRQIAKCDLCQRLKRGSRQYGNLAPRIAPFTPWQTVAIDCIGPCQCLMPKGTFHPMNLQDKYKPIKDMSLQGSINPNTTIVMTWIPLTPQVQYQPLSKLPVMTHPTPNVLIA